MEATTKKTQVKTLAGHLTATNKKHLVLIFATDMRSVKVNRTHYLITEDTLEGAPCYKVAITQNESKYYGPVKAHTSYHKFTIS